MSVRHLNARFSSPPVPANASRELREYADNVNRHFQMLEGLLAAQLHIPPIDDETKDYILAYDATAGYVKWIETTETCP